MTWVQVSQEIVKGVWYSHLFTIFPQFVVIHTIKGFSIVNEAEVDVFLEFSCFFCDPTDIANLISDSPAFSKPRFPSGNFYSHTAEAYLENFECILASI